MKTPDDRVVADRERRRRHTDSRGEAQAITRIMLRPVGSSMPLGLFVFCFGTVLLSGMELGWIRSDQSDIVALVMLVFAAPLQLLAAVLAYLARDSTGGTAMSLFSMSWTVFGVFVLRWPAGAASPALGWFLLLSAVAFLCLAAVATPSKPFYAVFLFSITLRDGFLALHHFGSGETISHISGGIGLGVSAIALYGAVANLLADRRQEEVLPLFRQGAAKTALKGSLREQAEHAAKEAGVRQQL